MPALLLLIRIRSFIIPIPYFVLWLLFLALLPVVILVGLLGRIVSDEMVFDMMSKAYRIAPMLICVHGLSVDVESDDTDLRICFI